MALLALDLGNSFGWAIKQSATIDSGWDRLTRGKKDTGEKFVIFNERLIDIGGSGVSEVWYEDVRRHNGLYAARAYCGYLAVLQMYAYKRGIKCNGVGVGQIKRFWTGNGRADKQMMIKEANRRGFDTDNDNQADALALLHYVMEIK